VQTLRMKRASGVELDQVDRPTGFQWWLYGQQRTMRIVAAAPARVPVQIVQRILDAVGTHSNTRPGDSRRSTAATKGCGRLSTATSANSTCATTTCA